MSQTGPCANCGKLVEDHENWEGDPPNYRTVYLCPGKINHFQTPADKLRNLKSDTSRKGKRWIERNPTL